MELLNQAVVMLESIDSRASDKQPRILRADSRGLPESPPKTILPLLWRKRPFKSVLDVGCGTGTWLHVARKLGGHESIGLDGFGCPWTFCHRTGVLQFVDLELSLPAGELLICASAWKSRSTFGCSRPPLSVTSRPRHLVLFSAAIPCQGGYNHLNEQWPEYWLNFLTSVDFMFGADSGDKFGGNLVFLVVPAECVGLRAEIILGRNVW